jgi:hypothetical protein
MKLEGRRLPLPLPLLPLRLLLCSCGLPWLAASRHCAALQQPGVV